MKGKDKPRMIKGNQQRPKERGRGVTMKLLVQNEVLDVPREIRTRKRSRKSNSEWKIGGEREEE